MESSQDFAGLARRYKDYIFCVLALVVCAGTVALLILASSQNVATLNLWISHSHMIIGRMQNLSTRTERMMAAQRGYVLTGETGFAKEYDMAKAEFSDTIGELNNLFEDNAAQTGRLKELEHYFLQYSERLDGGRMARAGGLPRRAEAAAEAAKADLNRMSSDILLEEQKLLDSRISYLEDYRATYRGRILGMIFVTMALGVAFGAYFMRKQRRRELTEQSLRDTAEGKTLLAQHKFACTAQGRG